MEQEKKRGGRREGAGRKANDRSIPVLVRITIEASDKLNTVGNKSEFIDNLIKQAISGE